MKINFVGYNFTHRYQMVNDRQNGADSDILILTKKPSVLNIDSRTINVPENSIIMIKRNTPYRHTSSGKYYCDDWLHYNLSDKEKQKYNLPYNTVITTDDITILSFYIERIYNEMYAPEPDSERKIELFFELLYIELMKKVSQQSRKTSKKNSIYNIRAAIYHYPERRFQCSAVAARNGISLSKLQHQYKEAFGVSIVEDAILARIERAKYLLKNSNYQVKEISEMLGYKSEIQFMRQFKKNVGITALQYRKT